MEKDILHKTKVWIRISVNGPALKQGSPYGWRFFINKKTPMIQIKDWNPFIGTATKTNFVPGTSNTPDENDLVGWIDVFGDIVVENDIATITLLEP